MKLKFPRHLFIGGWKVLGALLRQNDMHLNSNSPKSVMKAVLYQSWSRTRTCQQALVRSKVDKNVACPRAITNSFT